MCVSLFAMLWMDASDDEITKAFHSNGVVDMMRPVLEKHIDNASVMEQACWAVRNLSIGMIV